MTAGRTKTHPLPEVDRKQEVFGFTPATLSIKESWSLTQARWFHEVSTFWSVGFLNKGAIPCPSSSSFTLLASRASNRMSLGLVTNCEESARSLAASGQPTWLESFWVRLQQLPKTFSQDAIICRWLPNLVFSFLPCHAGCLCKELCKSGQTFVSIHHSLLKMLYKPKSFKNLRRIFWLESFLDLKSKDLAEFLLIVSLWPQWASVSFCGK